MKLDTPKNNTIKEHLTGVTPRPALTPEERLEQRKRDKEFMQAMNEFVAKYGTITDDEFFRVI
ncbi:hypothetical protein MXM41_01880 [Leclercia adecarboxylata]|uniref:hypothetical protein n=1 Tax=Leclercia adecarboxylata TaxID=83655 RepID=UPI002DBD9B49|nr:hypothetical protein [Leclercia adecarboxylata]MEB6377694.1 hypothetical protein [Leclercia adecarboxylata]